LIDQPRRERAFVVRAEAGQGPDDESWALSLWYDNVQTLFSGLSNLNSFAVSRHPIPVIILIALFV
jgi:hypothetical protein